MSLPMFLNLFAFFSFIKQNCLSTLSEDYFVQSGKPSEDEPSQSFPEGATFRKTWSCKECKSCLVSLIDQQKDIKIKIVS